MKASVTVVDHGLKKIKARLFELSKNPSYVKVGLLGDGKKNNRTGAPLTNSALGIIHEFGTSVHPPRPFIMPSFQKNKAEYLKMLAAGVKKDIHSESTRETVLALIGQKVSADMKAFIATNQVKPASGGPGKTTLLDTARMMNSITYAVIKKMRGSK